MYKRDSSLLQKGISIAVSNVTVAYADEPVLWRVSTQIPAGILLGIIGPNGAGKTTYIKSLMGLIRPITGSVTIGYDESVRVPFAYVPQRMAIDWDFPLRVIDVVLMGCYPRLGWFARPKKEDYAAAYAALEQVCLSEYAERSIADLSGGQQQRVFLARALVQQAPLMLLDEPFNGVDMYTEDIVMTILKEVRNRGTTVLVVHHNMYTVERYFDWLLHLEKTVKYFGSASAYPGYGSASYGVTSPILVGRGEKMLATSKPLAKTGQIS